MAEIYTGEDLSNLNSLDLADLWTELHRRLKLEDHRLTHGQFCAFRGALIRNPIVAAAADLDEELCRAFPKSPILPSQLSDKGLPVLRRRVFLRLHDCASKRR